METREISILSQHSKTGSQQSYFLSTVLYKIPYTLCRTSKLYFAKPHIFSIFIRYTIIMSKLINNMIAVSGCICFTVLLDLFTTIPSEFRIFSQIRSFTPLQVLINSSIMDPRLIRVGQRYLTVFQSAPIIYGVIAIVLCLITIFISRKHIFS